MPTIRKVKSKTKGIRWRGEVWVNGQRESKMFDTKPQAVAWSFKREAEFADDGRLIEGQTLAAAIEKYISEVAYLKKGARAEIVRMRRLMKDPLANVMLQDLKLSHANEYRDRRMLQVQGASVTREMSVIASVVKHAVEWGWLADYPWGKFIWPDRAEPRTKVYSTREIQLIVDAAKLTDSSEIVTRQQQTAVAFLFAIETAARQAEICKLEWSDISETGRTAHLRETKNGKSRRVPLSPKARDLLARMPRHHIRPWPMTPTSMSQHFMRIRKKAGITDGTFHDSRRLACVRMSKFIAPMDLAKISGHKDLKMLLEVYYQADAEALADLFEP